MNYTGRFLLAPGADLFPAAEIAPNERARAECQPDDFVLTRAGSRQGSRVIDPRLAQVLTRLVQPGRIVDAVLSASRELGLDPEQMLDDAFPGLSRLIGDGFLVPAGTRRARENRTFPNGSHVGAWEIVSAAHLMEDSAVYQVREPNGSVAALKIAAPRSRTGQRNVTNELAMLTRFNAGFMPRLIGSGTHRGCRYLVTEWRHGPRVGLVASELRELESTLRRPALIDLCVTISDAYAELHEAGIVHGDVHDGNLLIDARGELTILDYGITRDLRDPRSKPPRGAAGHAWAPDHAAAALARRRPPAVTPAAEQFTVASLLFELVTGLPYADFSYNRKRALTQMVSAGPRPFIDCGAEPWPELERVLGRALSKRDADRYPTTRAFADALRAVQHSVRRRKTPTSRRAALGANLRLDHWISELAVFTGEPSAGVGRAPTASIAYGAAGVAYALLRLSRLNANPRLLAAADMWAEHAVWSARHDGEAAFGDSEMPSASVGPASLYFSGPGIHVVRALVGLARGEVEPLSRAARALARSAGTDAEPFDLALGAPGLLLACALLVEATPPWLARRTRRLVALGDRLVQRLWARLEALPGPMLPDGLVSLGMAHGWAGVMYATVRWARVANRAMPNELPARLEQLAATGVSTGRGVRFPWRTEADSARPSTARYMPGWCNGSAGFVHLWLAASDALSSRRLEELAEQSAWDVWEDDSEDDSTLCCGLPGRAYSLLAWYRRTGEVAWLRRASALVRRGITTIRRQRDLDAGLLKGHLSLPLLEHEIARPLHARMPLFEPDGWRDRRAPHPGGRGRP